VAPAQLSTAPKLQQVKGPAERKAGGKGSAVSNAEKHAQLDRHLDRLFTQKIQVFGPVKFTRGAPWVAVVKAVAKAMVEFTRLIAPLTKQDYRALQLDVQCFRVYVSRNTTTPPDEGKTIALLLDEVLASARDRCADQSPALSDAELAAAWDATGRPVLASLACPLPTLSLLGT